MCADYTPSKKEAFSQHFGVELPAFDYPGETFPGYLAPILRNSSEYSHLVECVPACFGMLPHWADPKLVRQTYNARSETVAQKPSFRNAWRRKQLCIIPAENIFEPSYASGKALRWRIEQADGAPLGIAGIWEWRADGPDGLPLLSFSMLTINADAHPLMHGFHKPDEEKRMVVVLQPGQYQGWLDGLLTDDGAVFAPYPAERLRARPDPMPPRRKSAPAADTAPPPQTAQLF